MRPRPTFQARTRLGPIPRPLFTLLPTLLIASAAGVQAQDSPAGPGMQTIVVSAQKREQAVQNVPLSLTALSGRDLEAAGIDSSAQLGQVAVGLTVGSTSPGYLSLTIRGISDLDGGLLGAPATGFYIDETPLSAFAFQLPQLAYWDAERVEVLRGPQGTLFGEGSMGGTVRLITTKPDAATFAARVMLGRSQVAGGGSGTTARAMVNVPLQADILALRITASRQDLIGWIDVPELLAPDSNNGKAEDTRIALRWTPSKRLTVDLSYDHQVLDSRDTTATSRGVYQPSEINPGAQAPLFLSMRASRYDLANLTVYHDLGPATLVGSLSRYDRSSTVRTDLTPYVPLFFGIGGTAERGVAPLTVKATTAELRLVSNGERRLNWTAGVYAKDDARQQARAGLLISLPGAGLPLDETLYTTPARNRAQALFGDAELRLSDRWALQAGLRHHRARNQTRVSFDTTSAIFPGFTAGVVRDSGSTASATSPKLGLSWQPSAALLVYARLSTGFRDGESNYPAPGYPEIPASYGPEKIRAHEVGLKAQPLPWLTVNAAVYQNRWTGLQLPFVTADGLFGYIQNAARARATGAEIELAARPMAGLRLGLNLARVDARITASSFAGAAPGNRIPDSPQLQAALSMSREFALHQGLGAVLSASYAHRSATFSESSNNGTLENEAHDSLYLKAGVQGQAWRVNLYVSNATQSAASHRKTATNGAIVLSHPVQPRTVGVEVHGSF